jgi:nicotinamidase-related amidase
MPRPEVSLDPEHTALVVVECQTGTVGHDSALPALAAAAAPILPVIARLARAARKAGAPVVHLTYVPIFGGRSTNSNTPLQQMIRLLNSGWTAGGAGTQVVDEIGAEPGDLVLPRHSGMSPTHSTELFAVLRNLGVRTVVLSGVSLNVAIPSATVELADEGFAVVIPRDTVAGTPAEYADSMLRHTLRMLAAISTADEVIAAWS